MKLAAVELRKTMPFAISSLFLINAGHEQRIKGLEQKPACRTGLNRGKLP